MARSFGARIVRDVQEFFEPNDALHDSEPENEYVGGTAPHPTQGDPAHGIPVYPDPLPGGHEYAAKEVVTPQRVDVPPPGPYYAGGMAHGVKSPAPHNGRIAPRGHERHEFRGETETLPETGHRKVEPIPVYITEPGAGIHPLAKTSFRQVTVVVGANPNAIVERNPQRVSVRFLNESAAGGTVRLKNGPDSSVGAVLPAAMSSYLEIKTQEQIWAVSDSAATVNGVISIIEEYKQAS